MSTGDKRYLGDVFINQENYERQKQFFRDVIDSYQYKYGGSFDAATLQGKIPEDFATKEQGEKADRAILSPLLLGKTEIVNISDSQYIYTDAILLDREDGRLDALSWYKNLTNDDVTDALIDIYNQVDAIRIALQNNIDQKLNADTYNTFIEEDYGPFKENVEELFEEFEDENGNMVKKLNAQLVNGIRFILITQDAYDALTTQEKEYWRNVYIIKDPSEIPPDYADPMKWQLTDGYIFRINNGNLEVSNGLSDTWKIICSLDDLLSGADFEGMIKEYIEEGEYDIPAEKIWEIIVDRSSSDVDNNWDDYPFLSSSLHDDFVKNITINGSSTNVSESVNPSTSFKTVDLNIENTINSSSKIASMDGLIGGMNQTLEGLSSTVGTLNNAVNNSNNGILKVNGDQTASINDLYGQLGDINRNIISLRNDLQDVEKTIPEKEKFTEIVFDKWNSKVSPHEVFGHENAGAVFYKREGICYVHFYISSTYNFEKKTVNGVPNYVKISSSPIPETIKPEGGGLFMPVFSWNSGKIGVLKIGGDGHLYYANTVSNQTAGFNIIASFSYICIGYQNVTAPSDPVNQG